MSGFYFPLTLGRPSAAPRDDERRRPPELDAWREGVRSSRQEVERIPEEGIFRDLMRSAGPGYTLVTGEPGAGKSTLLEQWRRRWAQEAPAPRLGLVLPVLVRFRSLNRYAADLLNTRSDPELAQALWAEHLRPDADTPALNNYYQLDPRLWTPLWLLDGLDEAAAELRTEEFLRRLGNLPGRVCLSCRTAIAQSLRPALQPGLRAANSLEIQPLDAREQRDFLAHSLGDETRADTFHRRIATNTQMRELAGNPLLLDLIAQVGEEVDLPASRAAFYERAVAKLWTKVTPDDRADDLRENRDTVLTALAASVGLTHIEFPIARLDAALKRAEEAKPADLRGALVTSGLLRLDRKRSTASFLHLTFQEYYLARALADDPFAEVLREHWASPRYEETLGLLLAMTAETDAAAADRALIGLVEWGLDTHRADPTVLWGIGSSPLRTALHLVSRSGLGLPSFVGLDLAALAAMKQEPRLHLPLSVDPAAPPDVLARLAGDEDGLVRESVAKHPATPPGILAQLSDDNYTLVRRLVARHPSTPPDTLARLAADECEEVSWDVAGNPATPTDILAILAADEDPMARWCVASNPATPPDILARLADDEYEGIRSSAATNLANPPDIPALLGDDEYEEISWSLAENPATPPGALVRLADDEDVETRWQVARNPATPPASLAQLANDSYASVREHAALNPSFFLEDLLVHPTSRSSRSK